jgi:hypothetical protein
MVSTILAQGVSAESYSTVQRRRRTFVVDDRTPGKSSRRRR